MKTILVVLVGLQVTMLLAAPCFAQDAWSESVGSGPVFDVRAAEDLSARPVRVLGDSKHPADIETSIGEIRVAVEQYREGQDGVDMFQIASLMFACWTLLVVVGMRR